MDDKIRELIEEVGWIDTAIIIEVQGNDEEHVKNAIEKMVERLEKEKNIKVYEKNFDKPESLKEKWYSIHVEIKFIARDFGRLAQIALTYSPSSVEIMHPKKEIVLEVGDAQNMLADIASIVTSMAHALYAQQGKIRNMQKTIQKDNKPP